MCGCVEKYSLSFSRSILRMESTDKCDAVISHFNGKFIKSSSGMLGECSAQCSLQCTYSLYCPVSEICVYVTGASEPLLCKFADGGQKKRQSQAKYIPNGRTWTRDAEVRLVSPVYNCSVCVCVWRESR